MRCDRRCAVEMNDLDGTGRHILLRKQIPLHEADIKDVGRSGAPHAMSGLLNERKQSNKGANETVR